MLGEQVFAPILSRMARGAGNTTDTMIRMLNLLALLSQTNVPLTIDQIAQAFKEGEERFRYPDLDQNATNEKKKSEARRTAFNRDKKALVDLGVPIVTTTLSGEKAGVGAYIIDKDKYSTIDFGLTRDELDALQFAAATVQIEQPWGRAAVQWLGGVVEGPASGAVAQIDASSPVLVALFSAVTARAVVKFRYHGRDRAVHPYGVICRNGFWYVVGKDTGYDEQRTFRVDRIEGSVSSGEAGAFTVPEGFVLETSIPTDPKSFGGGDAQKAVVRVDANLVGGVERELGAESVLARNTDGSVDFSVPCGNFDAFAAWLFGMVDRAVVVSPADVRGKVIDELVRLGGSK